MVIVATSVYNLDARIPTLISCSSNDAVDNCADGIMKWHDRYGVSMTIGLYNVIQ